MLIKSLRIEIATLALSSIIIVSGLILWFSVSAYETLYQKAASNDLNGLSENLAIDLIPFVDDADEFDIQNNLLQLEQYDNVRFALVIDDNTQVISAYLGKALTSNKTPEELLALSNFDGRAYAPLPFGMTLSEHKILAKKRIGDFQASLGFLIIENDLSGPLSKSKRDLLFSIFPWVVLTLLINVIIIFIVQNRALRPLVQLARFTRKIKDSKDYGLIAKVRGKKEISIVTEGLNSMLQAINLEVKKNKEKNALLEQQQEKLEQLANFDVLTGLPNRHYFMKLLDDAARKAKASDSDVILMYFDLDGFKNVNDSFGHEIGDRLLCIIAERIQISMGVEHTLARLGGDEFLAMIPGKIDDIHIKESCNRFIHALSQPVDIDQWNVQVGISLGVARASEASFLVTAMVANADIAMHRSKSEGRNRFTIFSRDMIESSRRKLTIANAINYAISHGEFKLFYQPKVDIHGKIIGYEALARWFSEELGFVSPAEFIPIAEQSGKIAQITEWLIERVCIDSKDILAVNDSLKIALNLSVHDLNNTRLIPMIRGFLKLHKVDPRKLEFEITESAYLDNLDGANESIQDIKAMGSSIALDDFGTGYSSLSYLTQINIDTLKIDKQFVDHIGVSEQGSLVTQTIIDMAIQLKLDVCAEGVETAEQHAILAEGGCNILQGYHFGKPEALDAILPKLVENQQQ
ncbi:EAL domain-containing protein [Glaciecola sp. MH2013]|uniref:EAL domain-containing protein n=1 Tax=Glaciecola sp. MH2013 TaxID=2785524 RepID=UPI00189C5CEF|nr:EAL domain-containing protein [Glaciecola sp. MH2013]MBF7074402.1 EAL domain-containing protein [Glaciecola sp. MH2013]